jgi:hypothetical protein
MGMGIGIRMSKKHRRRVSAVRAQRATRSLSFVLVSQAASVHKRSSNAKGRTTHLEFMPIPISISLSFVSISIPLGDGDDQRAPAGRVHALLLVRCIKHKRRISTETKEGKPETTHHIKSPSLHSFATACANTLLAGA